mgnify:CR=1 FL=1
MTLPLPQHVQYSGSSHHLWWMGEEPIPLLFQHWLPVYFQPLSKHGLMLYLLLELSHTFHSSSHHSGIPSPICTQSLSRVVISCLFILSLIITQSSDFLFRSERAENQQLLSVSKAPAIIQKEWTPYSAGAGDRFSRGISGPTVQRLGG